MTRNFTDDEITSAEGFNDALRGLLNTATQSGVNVLGGWPCRNGDSLPDWEVVVVELDVSAAD